VLYDVTDKLRALAMKHQDGKFLMSGFDVLKASQETKNDPDLPGLLAQKRKIEDRMDPMAQYKALAGEVESRNVQARQGMTRAERRARGPDQTRDVPREGVIVVWDGKEMASAPPPANANRGGHAAPTFTPAFTADLQAQAAFLEREAKAKGYADVDALLAQDLDAFMRLAGDWRESHQREGVDGAMGAAAREARRQASVAIMNDRWGYAHIGSSEKPVKAVVCNYLCRSRVQGVGPASRPRRALSACCGGGLALSISIMYTLEYAVSIL
jgi:hypothetical protein